MHQRIWLVIAAVLGLATIVLVVTFRLIRGRSVATTQSHMPASGVNPSAKPMPNVPSEAGGLTPAAATYDDARKEVLLASYAGTPLDNTLNGSTQTWTWTSSSGWTERHPASSFPRLLGLALGFDPVSRDDVLVGTDGKTVQTWTWDGRTWTQQRSPHPPALNESGFSLADDAATGYLMLATLANAHPGLDSLYRWKDGDWIELTSSTGPADRDQLAPGLASKPGGGLLFFSHYEYRGGCVPVPAPAGSACNPSPDPSGTLSSATWSWTAGGWVKETPSRAPRTLGTPNALVEDTTAGSVLAIDDMSTVWSWSATTWKPVGSPTSPTPDQIAATAFDAQTGSIIAVTYNGPTSTPATWRWTPREGWTRL